MEDLLSVILRHRVMSLNRKEESGDQTEMLDQIPQMMRIYTHGASDPLCAQLNPGRGVWGSASESRCYQGSLGVSLLSGEVRIMEPQDHRIILVGKIP